MVTARIAVAVMLAVLGRIGRRLLRGAAVASWSWSVELRMVAVRAFLAAAREHPDPEARSRIERNIDPPLPRRLRAVMEVQSIVVAGLETELHAPVDSGLSRDPQLTLLYFHGGAYLAGNAATHRRWVSHLTWGIGATAYVPNYRLAPQHKYPAAVDDAVATYLELLSSGVRPKSLLVAGDSAGGGLATALMLRLRDEGRPLPAGGVLFSPYTDLEHRGDSVYRNRETDYLPFGEPMVNTAYLGDHDPRDPYASPMYGHFKGIPPLLVFAGGREMILDDSTRLVEAAIRDGCPAQLHIAPDMYHVWPAFLPNHPETLRALAISAEFARANAAIS